MSITVSLTVTPTAPNHGDTVTAVYSVQGNNAVAPQSAAVSGVAAVGGQEYTVTTTMTLPGTAALPEQFAVPACPGLTFTQSAADPTGATFTAVVP